MAKAKRSGNQDKDSKTIILITALLNLVIALINLISRLVE